MDDSVPQDDSAGNAPKTTFIYVLIDPETQQVRYVGKADNIHRRFLSHLRERDDTHKNRWIKDLLRRNLKPIIQAVEEVPDELWPERECYWIDFYRAQGCLLTNTHEGGKGGSTMPKSPEHKAKIAAAHRGKKKSPESVAKTVAGKKGKKLPPRTEEYRRKLSEIHKGKTISPETAAKISKANRGRKQPPEAVAKSAAWHRGKKRPPMSDEQRHKLSEAHKGKTHSPETRAKLSLLGRGRKKSPEAIAKTANAKRGKKVSPEGRLNISLGRKRANAMKKNLSNTPTLWG